MRILNRALLTLAAAALASMGLATRAEATAVSLSNIDIQPGTVGVDIVVTGLNEPTGGYGFQVTYNPGDFTGGSFTNDPGSKLGGPSTAADFVADFSGGFDFPGPGIFDLLYISPLSVPALNLAQPGPFPASFVLAHVLLTRSASTAGTDLGLINVTLSKADGITSIPLGDASNPAVPEPASMLLLGAGLGFFVVRRRLSSRS